MAREIVVVQTDGTRHEIRDPASADFREGVLFIRYSAGRRKMAIPAAAILWVDSEGLNL